MTETIVNRVQITPHLAAEIAKLKVDKVIVAGTDNDPLTTNAAVVMSTPATIPVTAEAQRSGQVGSFQGEDEKTEEGYYGILAEQLSQSGYHIVTKVEFEKFKKEVSAAFKHLGLDTRKHFS